MDNLSGQVIKGYELRERIGAGGFGAVYRAYQTTVAREVAVKIILPGFANQPDFIRRFETEAQIIARLEHLHIVPLYDYWREPDGAYLVMRWLRGGSLRDALQLNGPFDLESTAALLDQIVSALATAHRHHIIHRDLKPGNVLLDEDGNAYLADFGIARDLLNVRETTTAGDGIIGSPDYLAPEQARSETVTPQTDIYSLGVVLYEMLTGQHPFPDVSTVGRLYSHLNDALPAVTNLPGDVGNAVNAVIQKATQKNPAHRYIDVMALGGAFRTAIALNTADAPVNVVEVLTPREQEILQYMVEGRSNKEIAAQLFVTVATVKWYITQIYQKLGVRSRVQAIVRARELDLITRGFHPAPEGTTFTPTDSFQPENPYKGLLPFETADYRDFFGREKLVEKLITRMSETSEVSRFLAVIGPSGSGKSSLLKAGLIPAVWQGRLPGSERWFVVEVQPGARPLDELEVGLTRVAAIPATNLHEHLQRDKFGLLRAANLVLPNDGSELVLIIDQFEEVFTLLDDERARVHFLHLLHAAVTEPRTRVRVVITLRADFYDRPLRYPEFGDLVRSRMETILPLSAKEMEQAIAGPVDRVGVAFEDGLIAQIIEEMHYQTGALPLLQYALTELFERRQGRLLTHTAYQEMGGAVGALAQRAEALYREFDPDGHEAIRQMFLRLVTLGEGTEDTRRRVHRSELMAIAADPEMMDEIIDTFVGYRLLSLDHDPTTRSPTVEVAHEAILREWERLRLWLDESREEIRLQRQFARATREWADSDRDTSFLLRGTRISQFQTWAAHTQLAFAPIEVAFLQASVAPMSRKKLRCWRNRSARNIWSSAHVMSYADSPVCFSSPRWSRRAWLRSRLTNGVRRRRTRRKPTATRSYRRAWRWPLPHVPRSVRVRRIRPWHSPSPPTTLIPRRLFLSARCMMPRWRPALFAAFNAPPPGAGAWMSAPTARRSWRRATPSSSRYGTSPPGRKSSASPMATRIFRRRFRFCPAGRPSFPAGWMTPCYCGTSPMAASSGAMKTRLAT